MTSQEEKLLQAEMTKLETETKKLNMEIKKLEIEICTAIRNERRFVLVFTILLGILIYFLFRYAF